MNDPVFEVTQELVRSLNEAIALRDKRIRDLESRIGELHQVIARRDRELAAMVKSLME